MSDMSEAPRMERPGVRRQPLMNRKRKSAVAVRQASSLSAGLKRELIHALSLLWRYRYQSY